MNKKSSVQFQFEVRRLTISFILQFVFMLINFNECQAIGNLLDFSFLIGDEGVYDFH